MASPASQPPNAWKPIFILTVIALTLLFTKQYWMPVLTASTQASTPQENQTTRRDQYTLQTDKTKPAGSILFPSKQPGAAPHSHGAHESVTLSKQAERNIGLRTGPVELSSYTRYVPIPGIVVERPGRSQIELTAPFTGIVTKVSPIEGQITRPNQSLFELRLTHEDLVTAQRDFLRSNQELDVIAREIKRLESAGEGVVAGKRVVEQKYEKEKTEAAILAQRQGLLLHGLSDQQVDSIVASRRLLQSMMISAPPFPEDSDHHDLDHLYHIQKINVRPGQHVSAGDTLGILADHCLLYVEGRAFEEDIDRLIQASSEAWKLPVKSSTQSRTHVEDLSLRILYIADQIDLDSRALRFYMSLPNEILPSLSQDAVQFVSWKYRPGQRMQIDMPLERPWVDQIVLPVTAVVEEGVNAFVFGRTKTGFQREPVQIIYRDNNVYVLSRDDHLVGQTVAMTGAYELQLELTKRETSSSGQHSHAH